MHPEEKRNYQSSWLPLFPDSSWLLYDTLNAIEKQILLNYTLFLSLSLSQLFLKSNKFKIRKILYIEHWNHVCLLDDDDDKGNNTCCEK